MRCLLCQSTITDAKAVYTKPCRHVFCERCASKSLKEELVCPLCNTVLPKDGVVEMDVRPDKQTIQKASEPGLGMQPKYLCQILQNGLDFWAQQHQNENSIYLQAQKRIKEDLEAEKTLNRKLFLSLENEKLRSKAAAREKEELQQQLTDLEKRYSEKSRSYRKLNEMYGELRQVHKRLESDLLGTNIENPVPVEESNHAPARDDRGQSASRNRRKSKHGTSRSDALGVHEASRHTFKERPRSTSISRSLHFPLLESRSGQGDARLTSRSRFDLRLDSKPESPADESRPRRSRDQRSRSGAARRKGSSSRYTRQMMDPYE